MLTRNEYLTVIVVVVLVQMAIGLAKAVAPKWTAESNGIMAHVGGAVQVAA